MRCLCGFQQKPDNLVILKHHLEDCLTTGALKDMYPEPHVAWRNREFAVVAELSEGEEPMELGLEIKRSDAARLRVEKQLADKQSTVQAAVQNLETPEEIMEAIENVVELEEPAVEEKPAPKKKAAPRKKKTSGS